MQDESRSISLGESELARRRGAEIHLRPDPMRLRFELPDILTADHHRLELAFTCSLIPLSAPAERQMLAEAFLSTRESARGEDVVRYFAPALRDAAARAVVQRPVAAWLDPSRRSELVDALRAALNAQAFSAGLDVLPPYHIDLRSPTLDRENLERSQRQLAERQAADQVAHLQRSAELLKQFRAMRDASPGLTTSAALGHLASADQGAVLTALLASQARTTPTATLYAVAGTALVRLPAGALTPEVIPLPESVGAFRSIQAIECPARLAIGANRGILVLDPADPANCRAYPAPPAGSDLAFNRVALFGRRLVATHSEAGLLAWDQDDPAAPPLQLPRAILAPGAAEGPRNLLVHGDFLLFSVGPQVLCLDGGLKPVQLPPGEGSQEPVTALLKTRQALLVVRGSGHVGQMEPESLKVARRDLRSPAVSAACLLPFFDSPRLLLATADGPVFCVSPGEDPLVTQYTSPYRGLRALCASEQGIAAISPDRQHLLLFSPHLPSPIADLHLTALLRHRLTDCTFFP